MKNFLKISLLTAILFTSYGAFAKDDSFSLKVIAGNEKSIVFFINDAQDINLSILTSEDEVVYEQKIRSLGASKKTYNLDAFPNGSYTLKLETPIKLTTYYITIEEGKALISTPIVKEFFKPVLVKEKEIITLNLGNQVKGAVEVVILNEYNEQLYSQAFAKVNSAQKFNVSKIDSKELTFVVKYKGEEYIETLIMR